MMSVAVLGYRDALLVLRINRGTLERFSLMQRLLNLSRVVNYQACHLKQIHRSADLLHRNPMFLANQIVMVIPYVDILLEKKTEQ
jgi:hypothetical protein